MKFKDYWKDIVGYEGIYKANRCGQIKRIYKNKKEKILKNKIQPSGYESVILSVNGVSKHYYVHRIIAQTFIHKNNDKQHPQVNHKNGIKNDNRYWNLEWCSQSENQKHAKRNRFRQWKREQ